MSETVQHSIRSDISMHLTALLLVLLETVSTLHHATSAGFGSLHPTITRPANAAIVSCMTNNNNMNDTVAAVSCPLGQYCSSSNSSGSNRSCRCLHAPNGILTCGPSKIDTPLVKNCYCTSVVEGGGEEGRNLLQVGACILDCTATSHYGMYHIPQDSTCAAMNRTGHWVDHNTDICCWELLL